MGGCDDSSYEGGGFVGFLVSLLLLMCRIWESTVFGGGRVSGDGLGVGCGWGGTNFWAWFLGVVVDVRARWGVGCSVVCDWRSLLVLSVRGRDRS